MKKFQFKKNNMNHRKGVGFTFIETLIVIGIISLLSTTFVAMINPAKRFEDARDKQREIHLETIYNAVERKITVEGGWFNDEKCDPLPQDTKTEIVDGEEVKLPIFKIIGTKEDSGYFNLFLCLWPKYLVNPLYDPDDGDEVDTHYQIWQNPQTKYVTLLYEREGKPPIVAGAKKYSILYEPIVVTKSVDPQNIAHTWAVVEGEVTDDGGATVWERGVIWGTGTICETETGLTILEDRIVSGEDVGTFEATITNLTHSTVYCVQAYARNDIGPGYGEKVSFQTLDASPKITTLGATDVAIDRGTLRGEVTSLGPADVSSVYRTFKWGRADECNEEECPYETGITIGGLGVFEETLDYPPLETNVYYSFQACARNTYGKRCGVIERFYTEPSPPIVTTKEDFYIGAYDATPGGTIEHTGGEPVTSWGICYAEGIIPTYPNDCIARGVEQGDAPITTYPSDFDIDIDNLNPGRGYWVFAFAKNGIAKDGIDAGFGDPFYFTTPIVTPIVETLIVDNYSMGLSADLGGNIIGDGGATIQEHGICQDIAPNVPVYPFDCLIEGGGQEGNTFFFTFKNFLIGQEYNIKAFAKNAKGISQNLPITFYPEGEVKFPILGDTVVKNFEVISAEFEGTIQNNGGAPIIDHGFCWSNEGWIDNNPSVLPSDAECISLGSVDLEVVENTINFNFAFLAQNLTPGNLHYVIAFAKNSQGYGYGWQTSFITKDCRLPAVETYYPPYIGQDLGGTNALARGKITDDGDDPRVKGGTCYGLYQYPEYPPRYGMDRCTEDREGEGEFESELTGLVGGNPYYYRAYAYNAHPDSPVYGLENNFIAGLENGTSCTTNAECRSTKCVDDVCCNNPCTGTCMACNVANYVGTCTPVPAGQDPNNECAVEGVGCKSSCIREVSSGDCNGLGACSTGTNAENIPSGGFVCTGLGQIAPVSSSDNCGSATVNTNSCQYTTYYRSCKGDGNCRTDNIESYSLPTTCKVGYATKGTTICTAVTTTNYCQAITNACNGICQKRTNYYGCLGSGPTCEGTIRVTSDAYLSTAGKVCSSGNEVPPNATINCRATIDCVAGNCSAPRYYEGCAANSASCTVTDRVSYDSWLADGGWVVNETQNKTGTSCTQVEPTENYFCDVGPEVCEDNKCQTAVYYRACAGDGNCRTDNTGAYIVRTNCASGTYCYNGSCVSGYCDFCGDCSIGSCTARASGSYADGCSICYGCNGSEIGSCTLPMTTFMGAGTYGCTETDMSCYNGSCIYKSPPGAVCTADGECSTGYCYRDADGDRYAASSGTKVCKEVSPLTGTDCYDANANARPGQTSYFTVHRGDGSFDYDCNGSISMSNCSYGIGSCSFSNYSTCYKVSGCCTLGCDSQQVAASCSSPTGSTASCGTPWTGNRCDYTNPNYYHCYSGSGCTYPSIMTQPACRSVSGTCACK